MHLILSSLAFELASSDDFIAAKYLFPLDANHGHLGVPTAVWERKYKSLRSGQVLSTLLRDPTLVALYRTAEHLEIMDPQSDEIDVRAKTWMEKRNVLGFFNGRRV